MECRHHFFSKYFYESIETSRSISNTYLIPKDSNSFSLLISSSGRPSSNGLRQKIEQQPTNYEPIAGHMTQFSILNKTRSSRFLTPRTVQTIASVQSDRTVQSAPSVQNLDALGVSRATRPSRANQRPDHVKRP